MKQNELLAKTDISKALGKLEGWSTNPKTTKLSFVRTFENHLNALNFIEQVTHYAQELNHHPDITFTYKKVKISLSTHTVKGITQKDIALAKKIGSIRKGEHA